MPKEWYIPSANKINDDDTEDVIDKKIFNQSICADKKPYFFGYNYPSLKAEYDKLMKEINSKVYQMFGKKFKDLLNADLLTDQEKRVLSYFKKKLPLDVSPSTMNRICWKVEEHFGKEITVKATNFDYSIYKSGVNYDSVTYGNVKERCVQYMDELKELNKKRAYHNEQHDLSPAKEFMTYVLSVDLAILCSSSEELCDILLDMCYRDGMYKYIVWAISGDQISRNVIAKNGCKLTVPVKAENGWTTCRGVNFENVEMKVIFDDEI